MRKPVVIGVLFIVGMLAAIIYSTIGSNPFRVEVCLTFKGQPVCKTASGATEEFALRSARTNACGMIASGVTDTIACENTVPTSVTWLSHGETK
jgi:hypothetical protein